MKPGCSVAAIEVASMFQAFLPLAQMLAYHVIDRSMARLSSAYGAFTESQRRCTVIYVMELVETSVALAFLLAAYPLFTEDRLTETDARNIAACANLVFSLYIFELLSRPDMRLSLRAHHVSTIVFFFAVFWTLEGDVQHTVNIVRGFCVQLLAALTEQSTFLGMVMYRFEHPAAGRILKVSAVQTLAVKLVLLVVTVYILTVVDALHWYIVVLSCAAALFPSQVYGAWAVWQVGRRAERRARHGGGRESVKGGAAAETRAARRELSQVVPTDSPCASPGFSPSRQSSMSFGEDVGFRLDGQVPDSPPQPKRKLGQIRAMPSTRMV